MQTLSTTRAAQRARAASLPEQFVTPTPLRDAFLEGPRQRNAILDALFYDVSVLSAEESARLAPDYAREGAILSVGPSATPSLEIWPDADAWSTDGVPAPKAIAVAGVGSSALGAAAFARNVADAVGGPVLAVVSGYGLADLLTEAAGGWFLFGTLNSMRHVLEPLDAIARPDTLSTLAATGARAEALARKSLDVVTLTRLLGTIDPDLIVGHSKGNLVISEALFGLRDVAPARVAHLAETAHIVTISARIAMPRPIRRVTDVMGAIDGFGLMNSRLSISTDVRAPLAWHHTNTELPFHLPVTETLSAILAES